MRDEKRIPITLNEIGRIWEAFPDLRLGQLLIDAVGDESRLFYIEDEDLVSEMKTKIYTNLIKEKKNG